jgi:hypothetical protein
MTANVYSDHVSMACVGVEFDCGGILGMRGLTVHNHYGTPGLIENVED